MMRLLVVVAAVVGLLAAARSECSPPERKPGIDGTVWQAAGVVALPRSVPAPPLRLAALSGEPVDLRQLRGRLIMVYFWATW